MLHRMLLYLSALFVIFAPSTPAQNLGREELIRLLKDQAQVEVIEPAPVLETPLLSFLYEYFTTAPRFESPIRLHSTLESGPVKVWRKDEDDRHIDLYFAKNAGSGLLQNALQPDGAITLTVEYHNDLSHQLTDALHSSASLKILLRDRYRISTDCPKSVEEPCTLLKKSELITLHGMLEDLPDHVRDNLRLSRIHRYPDGISYLPNINAVAAYSNGVIWITHRAFEETGDLLGEGTLAHEMGHAVWAALSYDLRMGFEKLSWTRDPVSGSPELKSADQGHVSRYSMESPEEDFAEHFSAYVAKPELLLTHSPEKKAWLKRHLFLDTEYFTTGDPKTRIFVPSKSADTTPPRFLKDLRSSIEVTHEPLSEKRTRLRIRLKGVVDDLSGVASIKIEFMTGGADLQDRIQLEFELDATTARGSEPDEYLYEQELNREHLTDQNISLRLIRLCDRAGNFDYLIGGGSGVSFPLLGTATPEKVRKYTLSFESERQRKLRKEILSRLNPGRGDVRLISGGTPGTYLLHLPSEIDRQEVKLQSATLTFQGVKKHVIGKWRHVEELHDHRMTYAIDRKTLDAAASPSGFDIPIDLRQGVNLQQMLLDSVSLRYRGLTWDIELWSRPVVSGEAEFDEVIEPHSVGSDPTPAEIELNGIEIELEEKQDSKDLLILRTRFPIRGFEHGGRVRLTFQTPSGKTIFGETREIKPGRSDGTVEIPLDRFREQGEYQLMEFELMENSPPGSNPAIHEGKQHRTQKVSIRGIRKTVVVRKPAT